MASGLPFPEGPIVIADGSALVVEIGAERVTRVASDSAGSTVAGTGCGLDGAAICRMARLTSAIPTASAGTTTRTACPRPTLHLSFNA